MTFGSKTLRWDVCGPLVVALIWLVVAFFGVGTHSGHRWLVPMDLLNAALWVTIAVITGRRARRLKDEQPPG
jgi:hypothetical protein